MARKTKRELSRIFAAEKLATPGTVAVLKLQTVGTDKALRFVGSVGIAGVEYEVASDNGRIKTFTDVDSFLKHCAGAVEVGTGVYQVEIETGALLASSVPSDIKVWAGNQITKLGKTKIAQQAVVADLDAQLGLMAGWDVGNAAQQAKLAETLAQKVAVNTDIAAIDTEVVRLTAIVNA